MTRCLLALGWLLIVAAGGVHAHHGYAAFFDPAERIVTIEGRLERFDYRNPHVVMLIRQDDGTLYEITWNAATQLRQTASLTPTTFSAGDRLSVTGAPSRDPQSRELTRIQEVHRPADSWRWRNPAFAGRPS
jgi:hypothetical protein